MNNTTAWLITIGSFVLLALIWRMSKPKWLWIVKPIIAGFGACAFALTDWGGGISRAILWLLDLVSSWFGFSGAVTATLLVIAGIIVIVRDVGVDRVANTPALVAIVFVPLLALVALGPIGESVRGATANVANAGAASIGRLVTGG